MVVGLADVGTGAGHLEAWNFFSNWFSEERLP
jgi:hypothetical protein